MEHEKIKKTEVYRILLRIRSKELGLIDGVDEIVDLFKED